MITIGSYTLCEGKEGDKPVSNFAGVIISQGGKVVRKNIPSYVLLLNGEQIGAMNGRINWVLFIEIFDPHKNKGHGYKFVEFVELEAKRVGHNKVVFFPVISATLEHILQKRGYVLTANRNGDKEFTKIL